MRATWVLGLGAGLAVALTAAPTRAATKLFNVNMTGAKEVTAGGVPNQGDPDGSAVGTVLLDNGTGSGTTGSVTFNLTLANLDLPLSAWHIHTGGPTTTGSPLINFGNPETLRSGNLLSGTVSGLSATDLTTVMGNPNGFYLNIHNTPFPGGAVRDQVPEPGSLALLGVAAVGLLRRRPRA